MNTLTRSLPALVSCLLLAACNPIVSTGSSTRRGWGGAGGAAASSASSTASSASSSASSAAASSSTGSGGGGPLMPIHLMGRFDSSSPAGPRFAWPGSAIAARFSGTGIDIHLSDSGSNYLEVVVDHGAPTVFVTKNGQNTYTLASNLPDGEHDLWIEKRTESTYGVVLLLGLSPAGGKPLVPTPAPFDRTIELVGDSITLGFAADGIGPICDASEGTMDEYFSYGALTARALDAAHVVIAYSGIGVYRDMDGNTVDQMPVRYPRTLADDPTSVWGFATQPDVVVINLGDNDFDQGDPGQPYVDAYVSFVKQVRGHYPNAFIMLAVGSMMTGATLDQAKLETHQVVDALRGAGDMRVSFVDLGEQDGAADGYGCASHPSLMTHAAMAAKLTAAVKQVTGW